MPDHNNDNLPGEVPVDESERIESLERDAENFRRNASNPFSASIAAMGHRISHNMSNIELASHHDPGLEIAHNRAADPPGVAFADPEEPSPSLVEMIDRQEDRMRDIARLELERKTYNLSKYNLIYFAVINIAMAATALLYSIIKVN